MRRTLALLACLAAAPALAVDTAGQGRVWAGLGYDSNARRDFTLPGDATQGNGFGFLNLGLEGLVEGEAWRVTGTYDGAGRKFASLSSEDTLVQNANLDGTLQVARTMTLGLLGRARDRRGAERDYTDLLGGAAVDYTPDALLTVHLEGDAHRFLFHPRFPYSYFGPTGTLSVRAKLSKRHHLAVFGTFEPRTYNGTTNANPDDPNPPDPAPTRKDSFLVVGAGYTYKGPFIASVTYSYLDQASNSWGETLRRHRLAVTAGVRLPWKWTLLASGAAQLTQYPDGVYLSSDLQVAEDDENSTSLSLKLVRPLDKHLDLDLRYAVYGNTLPQNHYVYVRHVGSVGLTFNF